MTHSQPADRRALGAVIGILLFAPLALLGPALFGDAVYLPFDPARFAPAASVAPESVRETIAEQPANFDPVELPLLVMPEFELAQQEVAAGRFPSWNPYARFGGPLFGNGLAGLAYPPNLALWLSSDPVRGLAFVAWVGFAAAGLLAFGLFRACGLQLAAACLGALVFEFGGTLAAQAPFYMRMHALVWLPGILLAALQISRSRARLPVGPVLGLAACLGMTWLAGFPPYAIACTLFAGLFAVGLCVRAVVRESTAGAVRITGWLAAAGILGLGVAAVQLFPVLAYFPQSSRDLSPSLNEIARQGWDPMGLLGFLLPDLFASPDGSLPTYPNSAVALLLHTRAYWEDGVRAAGVLFHPADGGFSPYNHTEYAVFLGTGPALLGLLGLLQFGRPLRTVMLGLGAAFTILAIAPQSLSWFYELPGVLKTPMRFMGPVALVGAACVALGLDALLRGVAPRRAYAVAAAALVVALVCAVLATQAGSWDLIGAIAERYAHLLPADDQARQIVINFHGAEHLQASRDGLVSSLTGGALRFGIAGLALAGWTWVRTRSQRGFRLITEAVVFVTLLELLVLASVPNTTRVRPVGTDTEVQEFLASAAASTPGGVTVARASAAPREPYDLPSGLLFAHRVRDLNAYAFLDPWSHRLFVRAYGEGHMMRSLWPRQFPDDARLATRFFDLLGLRFVLSTEELQHAGEEVFRLADAFFVYERPDPMPRAFVVPRAETVAGDEAALDALVQPDLDPTAAVFMTEDAVTALPRPEATEGAFERRVDFVVDHPDEIELQLGPGPGGYLVLADACLAGWSATIDGEPARVERGNLFMRVVTVDPESRTVRFVYTPPGLALGGTLTGLSLLVLLGLGAARMVGSRRRSHTVDRTS